MLEILQTQQISEVLNQAVANTINGEAVEINADNILEIGQTIANAKAYGNFINNLLIAINDIRFLNKTYQSKTPSLDVKVEEFGQIREVVRCGLDDTYNNQTFEVQDGGSYDDNVFIKNEIQVTFFNMNRTYEVRKSIYKHQIANAFTSMEQMSKLITMLFNQVNNSLKIQDEVFEKYCYSSAIAETIHASYGSESLSSTSTNKAVNLLYLYNQSVEQANQLTTTTCWNSAEFLRFCLETIEEYQDDSEEPTKDYQLEGVIPTWTENPRTILVKKFLDMIKYRLKADTYNESMLDFVHKVEPINNWGLRGNFANKTTIKVKTNDSTSINCPYVIGLTMEKNALVKYKHPSEIEMKEVKSAQFTNYWFKQIVNGSFDPNENFICFIVA